MLNALTKNELIALCKSRNVVAKGKETKDELINNLNGVFNTSTPKLKHNESDIINNKNNGVNISDLGAAVELVMDKVMGRMEKLLMTQLDYIRADVHSMIQQIGDLRNDNTKLRDENMLLKERMAGHTNRLDVLERDINDSRQLGMNCEFNMIVEGEEAPNVDKIATTCIISTSDLMLHTKKRYKT